MTTESIKLRQHLLGMEPYVLLTFTADDDDTEAVKVGIEFGGGIPDRVGMRDVLLLALSQLGPFSDEEIEMLRGGA